MKMPVAEPACAAIIAARERASDGRPVVEYGAVLLGRIARLALLLARTVRAALLLLA
ncbi:MULTISPECIES: hypothetical protein [Thioclava]|uniref:hypothetical protein n=1 Tax=Thioclava TaxID=285107 RepID=UPI001314F331|nr:MULTISPECIES: hypothetical protein [Thioclava]